VPITDDVLDRIPLDPGVYLFKDAAGEVIYVGKAVNLRARVRQYFHGGDERLFVAAGFLARAADDVETIVVPSEKEALLLENHLIKQHHPRFNVKLRDDKQYLVLRVLPPVPPEPDATKPDRRVFPRVEVVRNIRDDGARYWGPYHSATSARETLRLLNRHFQLRTCTDHVLENRGRVCLQYQIKRCTGPCAMPVAPASYKEQVDDVMMFLGGKNDELVARLHARMEAKSAAEDFEAAATLRDQIAAVERTLARQHVVQDDFVDQDVWGLYREGDVVDAAVLFVRAGKLVGRRTFHAREQERPDGEVLADFVQQYYATGTFIPDEVMLSWPIGAAEAAAPVESVTRGGAATALGDWLGSLRGRRVKISEPQRGTRARLVDLADKNAAASAASRRGREEDQEAALRKLQERLSLRRLPKRIECFDIAHIQGAETVASMVTFVDGVPARGLYRKFRVRSVANDDFAAMYEVLGRRFKRAARAEDPSWAMPDLVVIDGGKGQLASALAAIGDAGVALDGERALDVIGLAKERELAGGAAPDRVYLRHVKDAVQLRANSAELFVLARIRDEAHRFANTFHRDRRSKAALTSELDAIPGIGPTRRKQLLRHFGSVRAVRAASIEELGAAPGMTRAAAEAVAAYFAASAPDADLAREEDPADADVEAAIAEDALDD
jgi:excinuclease ABC subunit C